MKCVEEICLFNRVGKHMESGKLTQNECHTFNYVVKSFDIHRLRSNNIDKLSAIESKKIKSSRGREKKHMGKFNWAFI